MARFQQDLFYSLAMVSDPDVHSDLTNPPTPVVEGKHMQCRYIPLDLEKSQAKIDPSYNGDRKELESQTQQDAHFAPIIWALRDSEEEDSLARLAKYYHYLRTPFPIPKAYTSSH
ncbi:hypothetical protein PRZ48_013849 [Zasmidium cellare]|uniref:Uncharacterized protein n=1 Tax=Zasmidium cellare TaxID=395010 RepID=A0ABR0E257_ZASCE|nr:hypothetical protein PRZ48_013849 [Zasmidium cellare]